MDAVIVSLDENHYELIELAETLDINIQNVFTQKRRYPHPRFFIGKGKLEEIMEYINQNKSELILINGIIKPSQHYNIEKQVGIECIDRVGLILKIFKKRAITIESKLQIDHAILKYEIPLLREWIHRSKSSEHPGFMAGGEYRIDIYYDLIQRRINKIGKSLKKVRADRDIRRGNIKKLGFTTLSLVGYTNAGKSSLFNLLTKSDVFVDDKMFATLSTTSRRISNQSRTIILVDTIGFIDKMPHWLIESFKATLEEINKSDLLLWIFDGKAPRDEYRKRYNACIETLNMEEKKKIIPVLNKSDLLAKNEIKEKENIILDLTGSHPSIISSKTSFGIEKLIKRIIEEVRYPIFIQIILKSDGYAQSIISWLFNTFDVIKIEYRDFIVIDLRCRESDLNIISSRTGKTLKSLEIIKQSNEAE